MKHVVGQNVLRENFDTTATRSMLPDLPLAVWLYRYTHRDNGWVLSVATCGEPQSGAYSLGGFRIAPANRTDKPGYSNDAEAMNLAVGMEGKVFWSRLIRVGGPLGIHQLDRIVGGKCVLHPSADARVGQPRDTDLLDFATTCLTDLEAFAGIHVCTGQDLGHGTMSDGKTPSLNYLHQRFPGSMLSDTAKPTGEGNYQLLVGALQGLGIPLRKARVGLIGCGNVGGWVLDQLAKAGATVTALEAWEPKRKQLAEQYGITVVGPTDKATFLRQPMDALVVNANGGTLDDAAIDLITANEQLRFVTGCENLAMTANKGPERLRTANVIYSPTELSGMVGYLTAVEEYLSHREQHSYDMTAMFTAARKLAEAGQKGVEAVLASNHQLLFEDAIHQVYRPQHD